MTKPLDMSAEFISSPAALKTLTEERKKKSHSGDQDDESIADRN